VRILVTSKSRYPARLGGNGSSRVHDGIARGLAELGHAVYYCVENGYAQPLPDGVIASGRARRDVDIYHFNDYPAGGPPRPPGPPRGMPWVHTVHDTNEGGFGPSVAKHFIWCSRGQAAELGESRYVWNGIDPEEFLYSETKDDYFVYIVSHLSRMNKGLPIAIAAVERIGARLIVAGHRDAPVPPSPNVNCVGYVGGRRKAELLAGARATFFPVQGPEAFGLVVAEALMSGTPVIGSRNGSVPELVTPDVGFICDSVDEYAAAAERVHEISAAACRERAMREFHYLRMAGRYVEEYERELGRDKAHTAV
jgi:glycosyltransferase involved in cell wall biosynthesis